MSEFPVYMDYGATTPVDEHVVAAMIPWLNKSFGNPASRSHAYGWQANEAIERARSQVAALIGADPREIIWTSGATESDNLAIKGAAYSYKEKGKHLITVKLVDIEAFKAAIRPDTIFTSVMLVNNEIGVIQDVNTIGNICREHGIIFHVDAAQATGKVAIDLGNQPIDLMSLASHKTYGPKGIGALYVRRKPRIQLDPQMHGGGHEKGLRSGTLPTHQIVGMGEAYRIAADEMDKDNEHAYLLHQRFMDGIKDLPDVLLNGHPTQRVSQNINLSFGSIDGKALLSTVKGIAVSSGSACTSVSPEPSYVLKAIGRSDDLAYGSLRITFGRYTTEQDIDITVNSIKEAVLFLRSKQ